MNRGRSDGRSDDSKAVCGTLYVCATPIGNLEDITLRVLRVLGEVAVIAAEDTRVTRKLLSHFDIHTPMTSYRAHDEAERAASLVERLRDGDSVALVSDAGTPLLSDPGFELVRQAIEAGVRVEALPGASACLSAVVACGLPASRFTFEGFLPVKGLERRRRVERWRDEARTVVFYEAPHRMRRTLEQLKQSLGDVHLSIGRELTKRHEEWMRGTVTEALAHVERYGVRGEYVVVVDSSRPDAERDAERTAGEKSAEALRECVRRKMREDGLAKKEAIRQVAVETGLPKRRVYAAAISITPDR